MQLFKKGTLIILIFCNVYPMRRNLNYEKKSERVTQAQKIVGLLTVRNEQILIEQCLRALSLITDSIVILDDASDDDTAQIIKSLARSCNIEIILRKKKWYRDEPGDKNKLLEAGRKIGGTHFIFIDADEMFTANCVKNNYLRTKILRLKPGQKMHVYFYNLWRNTNCYRDDDSPWKPRYINCIFCDDGKCFYKNNGFIHTPHIPTNLIGKTVKLKDPDYGLMHFQFVNWENLLIKQAWYRCLERIRYPEKAINDINALYAPSKDETNLKVTQVPDDWFDHYNFIDSSVLEKPEVWRKKQVLEWFAQYGKQQFVDLDIWDIDWSFDRA